MKTRTYVAIDLKSFYASVECVERGLDPLTTNLVVADESRTEKTICLAVSPSLKSFGVSSRPRLFEVVASVKQANAKRRRESGALRGESYRLEELTMDPRLAIGYITAMPRMAKYIEYSTRIYKTYLKYVAPEDIHVYSIDEVFMDVTNYLSSYKMTAKELTVRIIRDVLKNTGITATAGIGTNLYLCKVAMDIVAKRLPPDRDGVRIAELDEGSYRRLLWSHTPITDFWRVGHGYAKKLADMGLYTMGDVARCSLLGDGRGHDEESLYRAFGVNAELLIDHAWGYESCTMEDIKAYKPSARSLGAGQVLHCAYDCGGARIIALEMADQLALDLAAKRLLTNRITLTVNYDSENVAPGSLYVGEIASDYYGRIVPKHAHGTKKLAGYTSATSEIIAATGEIFDEIVNKSLLIRRINIVALDTLTEDEYAKSPPAEQLDIFSLEESSEDGERRRVRERDSKIQHALLDIKERFGRNAIVKGMSLEEGATGMDRNEQIGGHKA